MASAPPTGRGEDEEALKEPQEEEDPSSWDEDLQIPGAPVVTWTSGGTSAATPTPPGNQQEDEDSLERGARFIGI